MNVRSVFRTLALFLAFYHCRMIEDPEPEDITDPEAFSFMVSFVRGPQLRPAGSGTFFRIKKHFAEASNVVLSAAHNFCGKDHREQTWQANPTASNVLLRYTIKAQIKKAETDGVLEKYKSQTYNIKYVICHEGFTGYGSGRLANDDIALVILDTQPIVFKEKNIKPLVLQSGSKLDKLVDCAVAGWGATGWYVSKTNVVPSANGEKITVNEYGAYLGHYLRKLDMTILPDRPHHLTVKYDLTGYVDVFAAKAKKGTATTLEGDSGSPLFCKNPQNPHGQLQLAGLLKACPNQEQSYYKMYNTYVSIFSKVDGARYYWIEDKIKAHLPANADVPPAE